MTGDAENAAPGCLSPCRSTVLTPVCWILLIGAALQATMIIEAKPLQSANDRSRWGTIWSLLERRTFQIDEIRQKPGWDTIDLVYDGGHFYSTKPPILATWVAGIAWCVCQVTGWSLLSKTQGVTSVTLLIANGLPLFCSWLLWNDLLKRTVRSPWGHGLLLSTAVFATLVTPFAVTLNNHVPAAVGAMLTLYTLWRILRNDRPTWWAFSLCGFAAGWTCAHELPAALLGVATFLLCARRDLWKTLCAFVPAAVIPLAMFLLTNWLATGSFKPTYADYGSEKYRFVIDGVPSYWMEPKGIDRNVDSAPVYIFHCLVGHHGLFSLTPLWLLLIPAWVMAGKAPRGRGPSASGAAADEAALRVLSGLSLLVSVVVVVFYFTRTENYNYGGVSCGLRWALWLTPLWLVTLIPLVNAWADRRAFRAIVVPLFLISAFSAWSRIDNPWRHPWIFTWMEATGRIDLREPRPQFAHPLWTWFSAVPDVSDGRPRWMEFVNASAVHGQCKMRLQAEPAEGGRTLLTVTRTCGESPPETVCQVEVDREKFQNGAKPAEFLHWPDANVTPERQQADLAFLRGLPLLQQFQPGEFRYRKSPLRKDAFRSQHAFAKVDLPDQNRRYDCHAWHCDELPFGLVEVEFQVYDLTTGLMLHEERWQATASEPPPLPHAQWSPPP